MKRTALLISAGLTMAAAPAAVAAPAAGAMPAHTDPSAACAGDSGVTVVVQMPDATHYGCATGDPATGEEALTGAGFELEHDTSGMVCSIGHEGTWYPVEGEDGWTCGDFDGTYWSYWTAEEGDSEWTSSQVGAAEHDPAVGEAIGWRHGDGNKAPADGEVPAPDATGDATSESSPADSSPSGSEESPTTPPASDEAADGAAEEASDQGQSSWVTWALVGGVVLLAAAVVTVVLRRRR